MTGSLEIKLVGPCLLSLKGTLLLTHHDSIVFLDTDPNYRKYTANIDRALGLWDNVAEWADYISFLGKLLKALRSHSFPTIPHSALISTRLGQCLQSDLPSGVHQNPGVIQHSIYNSWGESV